MATELRTAPLVRSSFGPFTFVRAPMIRASASWSASPLRTWDRPLPAHASNRRRPTMRRNGRRQRHQKKTVLTRSLELRPCHRQELVRTSFVLNTVENLLLTFAPLGYAALGYPPPHFSKNLPPRDLLYQPVKFLRLRLLQDLRFQFL